VSVFELFRSISESQNMHTVVLGKSGFENNKNSNDIENELTFYYSIIKIIITIIIILLFLPDKAGRVELISFLILLSNRLGPGTEDTASR
jgi:hypothetical protein